MEATKWRRSLLYGLVGIVWVFISSSDSQQCKSRDSFLSYTSHVNPLGSGLCKWRLTWALGKARVSCRGTDVMDASLTKRKFKKENKKSGRKTAWRNIRCLRSFSSCKFIRWSQSLNRWRVTHYDIIYSCTRVMEYLVLFVGCCCCLLLYFFKELIIYYTFISINCNWVDTRWQ